VGFYETRPKVHSFWTLGHVILVMKTHEMRKIIIRLQKGQKLFYIEKIIHIIAKNTIINTPILSNKNT